MQRRTFMASLAALPAWSFAQGGEDTYPSKLIRLLLPYPAGGATDNIARLLAEQLRAELQQPVMVDNKPGANNMIAARALLGSPADGYTVMLTTNGLLSIAPALYKTPPFDTLNGVTQLGFVSGYPYIVVTRGDNPQRSMQGFIDRALKKSNSVSYVVVGNVTAVAGATLKSLSGAELLEVRYKGNAEAVSDLISGRVDLALIAPSFVMPLIKGGKLAAVAVTTSTRFAQLPDVPTIAESVKGMESFHVDVWSVLVAPAGLSASVSSKLSAALRAAVGSERFRSEMARNGEFPMSGGGDEVKARIQAEIPKWRQALAAAKIPQLD